MYSKIPTRTLCLLGHECLWSNSRLRVEMNYSARALSKASATDPIEGNSPASLSLLPNSTEVYLGCPYPNGARAPEQGYGCVSPCLAHRAPARYGGGWPSTSPRPRGRRC